MARQTRPFHIFVYGTLRDPSVFRAVVGYRLVFREADVTSDAYLARDAVLTGYKKISPDNTYLYAVPDPHGRIRGYVIGPLPPDCLKSLRHYEGHNYVRREVRVSTASGPQTAMVFAANLPKLEHSFGYQFRDPFKQEVLLHRKIDRALLETEWRYFHTAEKLTRRAVGELHGDVIRDLMRRHFDAGGISDFAIRDSLLNTPLRDFTQIASDTEARALASNYLSLVIRQVVFNQIEERIHSDFRYELDKMNTSGIYYERTISCVAALRMLDEHPELLDTVVADSLADLSFDSDHLVDFVRWAIIAADGLYDRAYARQQVQYIRTHMGEGYIPLGAELEFSNIGHDVIRDPQGTQVRDGRFDGFLYFTDFALDVLTWKLGGHLDDHHDKASREPRRGFFETALGNLSIEANLSKPVTNDPWLLSQFIQATRRFYRIAPHSVHLSLQLRKQQQPAVDNLLSLSNLKCLFALAGDLVRSDDGQWQIRRLVSDEIITKKPQMRMLFSEVSLRRSSDAQDPWSATRGTRGRYVQQYKFPRLNPENNYEVIAMALKGMQIRHRHGTFLTATQYTNSRRHRDAFHTLRAWGQAPEPLTQRERSRFLEDVEAGLMTERRGKPAHSEAYIQWAVHQLRKALLRFNSRLTHADAPDPQLAADAPARRP